MAAVQFQKVIGLQDHVVEFKKAQALLAVQPRLDAFKGQHPVHTEMPPDVPQEIKVVQGVQPFSVVEHQRIGRPRAIGQVARKHPVHTGDVRVDLRRGQQGSFFRAERRIAHFCGPATHQRDRLSA